LRSRDGRRLVVAFTAVTLAEWMTAAALAVHLFDVAGQAAVGLLALLFIPTAIAGLGAGGLIERRPPERVLVATAALRTLIILGAAAALQAGLPLGIVVSIVAVDAAAAAFYRPAQAAVLPFHAGSPAELGGIAGALSTTRTVSQALGIVLGGLLIATISTAQVFVAAAGLFLLAAASVAGLQIRTEVISRRTRERNGLEVQAARGVIGTAREGLSAFAGIVGHADSRLVIALAGLRAAVRGAWLGLAVLAAAGFLGLGRSGLGQLAAAAAVGALIAVPAASLLVGSPRLATALGGSLIVTGLALVGVAAFGTPGAAYVMLAIWGVGMALADLAATAVLPRIADARRFGQMTAVTESLKQAFEGTGSVLVPVFAAVFGVRGAVAAVGAAAALVAIVAWPRLSRVDARAAKRIGRIDTVRRSPLLGSLRVVELEAVASAAQLKRMSPGEDVIREGDRDARTFYVIEDGKADVLVQGRMVRTLEPGDSFGEIALLHGIQRTATVRAGTDLDLLELDRSDFIWAVTGSEQSGLVRRRTESTVKLTGRPLREALTCVPWLARLDSAVVGRLASLASTDSVAAGQVLWEEGTAGDTMIVLLDGEVTVERDGKVEATIGPGGWVGEVALLHDVPRTATVRAHTDVAFCTLQREHVHQALGMDDEDPGHLVEQLA